MKKVTWEDDNGKLRVSLIRNDDSDDFAKFGIPIEIPDISDILEEAKVELHNQLIERELYSFDDLQSGSLTAAINVSIRNKIVQKYRELKKVMEEV